MIEIRDLSKSFGSFTAVDGVTFEVQRGEVLGFLGPNGAGKSTTMRMVTGFLPPSGGSVHICGHDVGTHPREAKERLGYLPEGAPAYPDMTPAAFLAFTAEVRGMDAAARAAAVAKAARLVHLEGVMDQSIDTLSKGYKRRVGLAQAILHDPEVLVMDEPTDGLDPNQKHEVRALIREMAAEKAIVISTHILEEVEAVCTRAIVINRGRIAFDGTPSELLARSRHHGAVSLTLPSESAGEVQAGLEQIADVESVEASSAGEGHTTLTAFPQADESIVADISERAHSAGWKLEELRIERGRLDDVFRELTTSDTTPFTQQATS